MILVRALRDSISDRFSVLGFSVNADQPLYEIGLATDPDLFKAENRARRTPANFFASPLQSARPRSDTVYLVPPAVVARFVGQPRLYFGAATYAGNDRSKPTSVRRPDGGTMYVSLRDLTERGLRRGIRAGSSGNGAGYGVATSAPGWGGDALPDDGAMQASQPATGNTAAAPAPAPYSDGYPDALWRERGASGVTAAPTPPAAAAAPVPAANVPATAQALRANGSGRAALSNGDARNHSADWPPMQRDAYDDGFGPMRPAPRSARDTAPAARELRVVASYYNPSDWLDALRTQVGFFASSAQWFVGVDNTTVMPHSAICQARRSDGSADGAQHGTAFFIAPNLLLTAAHVVDGQGELIIVPGKNGAGGATANEPFGRFRVSASDMVKHPSYVSTNRDFDMALIRVPSANASANYFNLVEELTQSRPEGVVVCGYAAYSDPQGLIDRIVNATIDADKQHAHGGYIRSLPSDETFDYDLQSLGGTSGSPVYYIEDGDAPRTHMVGVHVAGQSDTTNLGCRITPAKLAWIRQQAAAWSQSLTFSLGARALADDSDADGASYDDADQYSLVAEPVEPEVAESQGVRTRALEAPAADYPGASRFVAAHARNFHTGRRRGAVIDRIVIHITAGGPRIDGTISWFQDGERRDPNTGRQSGPSSAHYIVGRDGEVVQMVRNADTAYHASAANSRSIGIEHNANKPYRLNRRDLPPTMPQYQASAHLVAWLAAQYGIPLDREHIVGHSEASPRDDHDCPSSYWDWDAYMQCVQLAAQAQAGNSSTGAVPVTSQGLRGQATIADHGPQRDDVRGTPTPHVPGRDADTGADTGAMRDASRQPARRDGATPGAPVRAQELITPYYDPSNPASALQCTSDAFSQQREEWYVGVQDTSAFPHSAICHLLMVDDKGDASTGTGFYIGPNRILTCAHNLHGMVSATVTPARNGAGSAPYGQFNLTPSQWRVAPGYGGDGDWDRDLAVIDNTAIAAPNGAYFRFLQATPGNEMPLAVCGYSAASRLVRALNPGFDRNKQHLHGGHAQGQPTPDTIDYDILAIAGASGSPVYTVRADGNGLGAFVCGVHVTRGPIEASGAPSVNRACFITPAKIEWIEQRATAFADRGAANARALADEPVQYRVALVPQPDKNACWAASMAMLKSFRSDASFDPEAFVREAGGSLSTSYGWDQLQRVRDRYGFRVIEQPSNASLYHTPAQWAQWLRDDGPLWVVIVGAPHAVVVSGIRGDLGNAGAAEVYVLNPWDTTTSFDDDPVAFNPPNRGSQGWMPFDAFAADFGNMAAPDYGNWRILHLPAGATQAQSQSLGLRDGVRLAPPPRSLSASTSTSDDASEPIEPTRVPGTRMRMVRGSAGASRWALDQLDGRKAPQSPVPSVSSLQPVDVQIDLGEWPALEGQSAPLPLLVRYRSDADGALADVVITAGTPTQAAYGVDVVARIEDAPDVDGVAAIRVVIDVRFRGLAQGAPGARIDLRLLGNGRYERNNRWTDTSLAA